MIHIELVEHTPGNPNTGIGRYTRELYNHLARHADRVTVSLTSTIPPPLSRRLSFLRHLPLGIRNHQTGATVHFVQIMGCAQMLWHPIRPAIATVHDLGGLVWKDELQQAHPLDRMLLRLSFAGLRRMDAIFTVSEFTRQSVIKHLQMSPERVHTIYSGIDQVLFRPIPDARQQLMHRYSLPGGVAASYVLYVGSELPRKNLETLLRALFLVCQERSDVHLLKVGRAGGEQFRAATIRLIEELHLDGRVHFYEDVPDPDLPLFYNAATVYVCPSLVEGFGFPMVEAAACGTPIVASAIPVLHEVAPANALFVPPEEKVAMSQAILDVLEKPLVRQRAPEVERYIWERTARGVVQVYELMQRSAGIQVCA